MTTGAASGNADDPALATRSARETTAAGFFDALSGTASTANFDLKGAFRALASSALGAGNPYRRRSEPILPALRDAADRGPRSSCLLRVDALRCEPGAAARALLQDPAASTPAAFAEVLDAYDARFTDQSRARSAADTSRGHRKTRSRPLSWVSRRP